VNGTVAVLPLTVTVPTVGAPGIVANAFVTEANPANPPVIEDNLVIY
jgi:hypothetical protein